MFCQLNSSSSSGTSDLTESSLSQFPLQHITSNNLLLRPGQQCRLCLHAYNEGDVIRCLPCHHRFHQSCIDDWLLHRHSTCPVDGVVYTNESVRMLRDAHRQRPVFLPARRSQNGHSLVQVLRLM